MKQQQSTPPRPTRRARTSPTDAAADRPVQECQHGAWQLIPVPPGAGDLALARQRDGKVGTAVSGGGTPLDGGDGPALGGGDSTAAISGNSGAMMGRAGTSASGGDRTALIGSASTSASGGDRAALIGSAGTSASGGDGAPLISVDRFVAGNGDGGVVPAGTVAPEGNSADAGMSTVEYAVGTIVAAAFAAVLYKIVTGDSVVSGLTNLINSALHTSL